METLLSGMLSKMGDDGIEKISQSAGIDSGMAKKLLAQAGPLIMGKMADNSKKQDGLESLNTALQNHDGSIFNRIEDVANPEVDTKGGKILGHIFGENSSDLITALSGKNNTNSNATGKLLEMAAPLILGQLGEQKKSQGLDTAGIFDLLQGEKKATKDSKNSVLMDLAENFLDKDNDGSIIDDVLGMAGKFFKK